MTFVSNSELIESITDTNERMIDRIYSLQVLKEREEGEALDLTEEDVDEFCGNLDNV